MKFFTTVIINMLLALACQLSAQSMEDFLASAITDNAFLMHQAEQNYLNTKPYRLSLFQKAELRMKDRELNPDYNTYAFRLTATNPWQIARNNAYYKSLGELYSVEAELSMRDALKKRYEILIDWNVLRMQLILQRRMVSLLKSKMKISATSASPPDGTKLLDLYNEIATRSLNITTLEGELKEYQLEIESSYHVVVDTVSWNSYQIISGEQLRSVFNEKYSLLTEPSLIVRQQQQSVAVAQQSYRVNKSNNTLGFFQTEYDSRRSEQGRTPINISLGITLPIFNANKGKIAKERLNIIREEHALQKTKEQQRIQELKTRNAVVNYFQQYDQIVETKNLLSKNVRQDIERSISGDPLKKAEAELRFLELENVYLKIYSKLLHAYVDFLTSADLLQKRPLVNYLSPEQNLIIK